MWILKNSKDLLDNVKSRYFSQVSSIKTFDVDDPAMYLSLHSQFLGKPEYLEKTTDQTKCGIKYMYTIP
jgi:hypothetical protein